MLDDARKRLFDVALVAAVVLAWGGTLWAVGHGISIDPATKMWTIPSPTANTIAGVIGWVGPVVAFVVFVGAAWQRRWILLGLTALISGCCAMACLMLGVFGATEYRSVGTVAAADGHEYVMLGSGFQDHIYWLGRTTHSDDWATLVMPIARSDDFAAPNRRIVRPRGGPRKQGVLLSSDRRVVVVEVWDACASIALDTESGRIWSSETFEDASTIEQLSPFILLDADDEPDPADVTALFGQSKCPRSEPLDRKSNEWLAHPNPAIRAMFQD